MTERLVGTLAGVTNESKRLDANVTMSSDAGFAAVDTVFVVR
jgi:hypothetical protein